VLSKKTFKDLPGSKASFFKAEPNQGGAIRTSATSKQVFEDFLKPKIEI